MDWLNHPRFVRVRDEVLTDLRRKEHHFRKLGTVVFLCGGSQSSSRERLAQYFRRRNGHYLVFYAETAWSVISGHGANTNALSVETRLAHLADVVIIIVESPGTFAELGAFANSEPLRQKLLPILDERYQRSESFIQTGPVRWVDVESTFGPSVWAPLDRILQVTDEIERRLARIPREQGSRRVPDLLASEKHLLFFVCDLAAVFGPCTINHIEYLSAQVLGRAIPDVPLMLGLGKAMGLLESYEHDGVSMFFRPLDDGRLTSFQHTGKYIDIPTLRARVLSAMQSCDPSADVLEVLHDMGGVVHAR